MQVSGFVFVIVLVLAGFLVVFIARAGRGSVEPPHPGDEGGPTGEPYPPGSRPAGPGAESMVAEPSPVDPYEPMESDPALDQRGDDD